MDFIAIDVETANADMASICQIGLAEYKNGVLVSEGETYVDPEDYFDGINVSIHGIDENTVKGAPKFPQVLDTFRAHLEAKVIVSHTHFDRVAMNQAAQHYGLTPLKCTWLDSARVARRAWEECAYKGYGLAAVCKMLGYEFKHHKALEDAKAAGHVILSASEVHGYDIHGWLDRVEKPIDPSSERSSRVSLAGNDEGPLYGHVLAFTGPLEIPRREAAEMAAEAGCEVAPGVTKKTTLLVVWDQDIKKLGGHEKSSKHRKAEYLIEKGAAIRIIRESDFKELVK